MAIPTDLRSRVALVIGGYHGIGAAIALVLAEAGAAVAVNYRERAGQAEAVAGTIRERGGGLWCLGRTCHGRRMSPP
jgi:3-oxoacyl-[acyl-carrier protein] reductase